MRAIAYSIRSTSCSKRKMEWHLGSSSSNALITLLAQLTYVVFIRCVQNKQKHNGTVINCRNSSRSSAVIRLTHTIPYESRVERNVGET